MTGEGTVPLILQTPRLLLRRLELADAAALFAYRSAPEVLRFQLWEPQDVAAVRAFIADLLVLELATPGSWYQLAITLRESKTLIGDLGLHFPLDEPQQAEIGITLAPAWQGQGYATEALTAALAYLFDTLECHRVYARADARNRASIALLERVGMRREGYLHESTLARGEWTDDVLYAILALEWQERSSL